MIAEALAILASLSHKSPENWPRQFKISQACLIVNRLGNSLDDTKKQLSTN